MNDKYKDIISNPKNDTAWVLQQVANELAISNKLKKIELKLMKFYAMGQVNSACSFPSFENMINEVKE